MLDYKELYVKLFAAAADANQAIEHIDFRITKAILIAAQQSAEESCISAE